MITRQLIEKYLWYPDHIKLSKPDPEGNSIIHDPEKEAMQRFKEGKSFLSNYSLHMQKIVDQYSLKQAIIVYRLCLFFGITKTDTFIYPNIVSATIHLTFLTHLLSAWNQTFPLLPKPIIARLFIPKGMPGFFPA